MTDINNLSMPSVANRAFVPLAVEAGIETVIASLVPLATDMKSLLIALKSALATTNSALADALTLQTLGAILDYMEEKGDSPVVMAKDLPELLDEDGPASVSAARDGSVTTQINVTFSAPPDGYSYEIYLDGVLAKAGSNEASGGFVNDIVSDVEAGTHTIRVLFVDADGKQTRFGPVVTVD